MKKVNFSMLFLAILVISMFAAVGISLSMQNVWLMLLFFILGCVLMGYGISLKRKSDS